MNKKEVVMIAGITQLNAQYTSVSEVREKDKTLLPDKNNGKVNSRQELAAEAVTPENFDFTKMSPREFGALFESGEFTDLPPLMLPNSLDLTKDTSQQIYDIQDKKVNYIEFVKGRIEFEKSIGVSTEFHEKLLNKMLAFQDESRQRQPMINSYA